LEDPELKAFYEEITRSEARHAELFVELALIYFPEDKVRERVTFFLEKDAEAIVALPPRPALH
jgi:tRNA-(ms[2]io[6]A)-hydroxylase